MYAFSVKSILASIIFTILMATTGIIIICFKSPKASVDECHKHFEDSNEHKHGLSSHPRSVVAGDMDNDSQVDIVVANSGIDSIGIFYGYGNGSLSDQTKFSTGSYSTPYSVTIGDLNNDKLLDIIIALYGINSVGVLFAGGNRTFNKIITFFLGSSQPVSIIVADFNEDSSLDIAVANYPTCNLGVLLGYGNGSFGVHTTYSTGYDSLPYAVATTDFNNDHNLDVAVANSGSNTVSIFLGYGTGYFAKSITLWTGHLSAPCSVAIGDFNNDNYSDITVANYASDNVGVFLGYGNGSFSKLISYSLTVGSRPRSVVAGHFYNDSQWDIAVVNSNRSTLIVLEGLGNGSFQQKELYFVSPNSVPFHVNVGDLNNDRRLDIVIVENMGNEIGVFLRYYRKEFSGPTLYSTGDISRPFLLAVDDLNNDTNPDIAIANYASDSVIVFLGDGDGKLKNLTTFSTGKSSRPFSVATGDFNNDQRLDLAVANSGSSSLGILFGDGNGYFENLAIYTTGDQSQPYSLAIGYFNNDSFADVVITSPGNNNIYIFLSGGTGTFASPFSYSTGINSSPHMVAIGDFNGDSHSDVVIANSQLGTVCMLFGFGNGSFGNITSFSTGSNSFAHAVVVGNFNGDHVLDIATADFWGDSVGILLGYGNGSFQTATTYLHKQFLYPSALAIGDFNNDKIFDLVVSDSATDNLNVLFGIGNGSFAYITSYYIAPGTLPLSVAVGNFNKDIWLDIVVTNGDDRSVGMFLGSGYLDVANKSAYTTGTSSRPCSVAIGDFNNDSRLDLVVANEGLENIVIHFGHGDGTLGNETSYSTGLHTVPTYVTVGDFNADNNMDIAAVYSDNDGLFVLLGYGNGSFMTPLTLPTIDGSQPSAIGVGDFNNDNRLDLAITNAGTNSIDIFLSFDYGNFRITDSSLSFPGSGPWSLSVSDFNNDQYLDVVVGNSLVNFITVLLGNRDGKLGQAKQYSVGSTSVPYWVATADLNNDSKSDIVVTDYANCYVCVCFGNGDGTFGNFTRYSTGDLSHPFSVSVGDINGDHLSDLISTNSLSNSIGIFFGLNNGTFSNMQYYSTGHGSLPTHAFLADFNNDSHLDIAVANKGTDNVGIFLGYGNGTFQSMVKYDTKIRSQPSRIAVGDINNDNNLDVIVTLYLIDEVEVFQGLGDGTFKPMSILSAGNGSSPTWIDVGYFNDDMNLDIAVANYGSNNLGIFFGYGDGDFTSQMTFSTGSGSHPIAFVVVNLNHDNKSSFIVTSWGTSSISKLTRESSQTFNDRTTFSTDYGSNPKSIAVGDFNNDHALDLAVAYYSSNSVGLFLGNSNGAFVKKQILYNLEDGSYPISIAVGNFNNDTYLDIALANYGTSTVGILFGYGNGTFAPIVSISTGQEARPYALAVSDFDNDNQLEIAVANDGSNRVRVIGVSDSSTLFTQSIFSVGYGAYPHSLVAGDFNNDGWPDLAIANYGYDSAEILVQIC